MRLWSLHPSLLDRQALVAGWREALLAQKVLEGLTRITMTTTTDPALALPVATLPVATGQLDDELRLLRAKVCERSPEWMPVLEGCAQPAPHPLFHSVPGGIESWERVRPEIELLP